jgi:hypothetical protein
MYPWDREQARRRIPGYKPRGRLRLWLDFAGVVISFAFMLLVVVPAVIIGFIAMWYVILHGGGQ